MASSRLALGVLLLLVVATSGAAAFRTGNTTAIHIGNTKACIAGYGGLEDLGMSYKLCIPSWVAFTPNGTLFGEAALNHAAVSPGTAVSGFKRVLGSKMFEDVVKAEMELVPYKLVGTQAGRCAIQIETEEGGAEVFSAHTVAGILISKLKRMAEAHLGRKIRSALLTVPWHWRDYQRHLLATAARLEGGFSAARYVDEHVAVAAALGHHEKARQGKVILVFHMGGRTTHATMFKFRDGTTRLIEGRHDAQLGGDDFTCRLVDHFVQLIREKHHRDLRQDDGALRELRAACERAKKALTYWDTTLVKVESLLDGADFFEPLTRAEFEELNRDLLARATSMVDLLASWRWWLPPGRWDNIDEIILVGGSVRIPKIIEFFRDYFHGREPIVEEEAAIRGAALLSRPESAMFTYDNCDCHGNPLQASENIIE
ncbi:luminal-binding protein-like [Triticum aestivum]|uniref:luminal-binding protein-like n=1 Tax=Triticum aestivum TaxID=4565 RepID=UPI001D030ADB|nr:luminal-binding protein-like [Triticum aestivum]